MKTAEWLVPLISAGAGALTNVGSNAAAGRRQQRQNAFDAEQNALDRALRERQQAFLESQADPYLRELQQSRAVNALDMLERSSYEPVRMAAPKGMRGVIPQFGGGASYSKSPEARKTAGALKRNIIAAGPGGTMRRVGEGQTPGAATGGDTVDLSGYTRRGGGARGGPVSGAVSGLSVASGVAPFTGPAAPFVLGGGALIGALTGAFNRRAKTAGTDLRVEDARRAIADQIRQSLGREAAPEEIDQALVGQGWRPGHAWVGQDGLAAVLRAIASQRPAAPVPGQNGFTGFEWLDKMTSTPVTPLQY